MQKRSIPSMEDLTKRIEVSQYRRPADLVIKNGRIINVFTREISTGDIAIYNGTIAAVGEGYEGVKTIDAHGLYVSPGFIDGHIHIESTTLTPSEFAKVILPHGVTTIITDPHEIANVLGIKGIQYMLQNSEDLPLDLFFVLPSSVPATSFEHAGALLNAESLKPFYDHPRVLGLAEVMDYPAVINTHEDMIQKIYDAHSQTGIIDGHLAGLSVNEINGYLAAGIRNDHECTTPEEALERIRLGMRVMIRQGSGSKNLPALIEAVTEQNAHRFSFCTDDKHIDELIHEGSVNHCVKEAIKLGLDPLLAYQMATLNAAQCYELHDRGAISPGMKADLILLSDLEEVDIVTVIQNGEIVTNGSQLINEWPYKGEGQDGCTNTVQLKPLTKEAIRVKPKHETANIIEIIPGQIKTLHAKEKVDLDPDGFFDPALTKNLQKLIVTERHQALGTVGTAIVRGFDLAPNSAIASTVSHDSHNLIAAGTSDEAILQAVDWLEQHQGGLVVIKDGTILAEMELRLGGLMSIKNVEDAHHDMQSILDGLNQVSPDASFNLLSILSFLALPVIPSLKLTDTGLFDVLSFTHIDV
ncbi:adenine deaminase [Jeotgalibacillus campisalis]|uniref:Adenine deaminase n=1 Tax=Jeotgalibacillus campisalis TaxID=220754 RepID=A0A0C2VDU2_9BACL|nr:adenine deaminase [Jeotgalibacillus campisalis]KIL47087.1 adenine deaminase [Jeotgalibacillus campisalis]